VFGCKELDERNWVVDFGGLKPLKEWLEKNFDHKVVLTEKDPHLKTFKQLEIKGLAELNIVPAVGVESFARMAFEEADQLVKKMTNNRCWVVSAECAEHGANSAIYQP